jgi:hypothetical protein
MSEVKCGSLKLAGDAGKDSHLNDIRYEVLMSQQSFAETVKPVEDYFRGEGGLKKRRLSLRSIDVIHSEGDIVSPAFTGGPTASVREPVIPLAFSIVHYDEIADKFTIIPVGLDLKTKVVGGILVHHIAFYLPRPSIYPFAITRFYKILYTGDADKLADLLRTVYLTGRSGGEYKAVERLLTTTLKKLKIPQNPTIGCVRGQQRRYYVVYRCQRSFSSAIIEPGVVDYLCRMGAGIIIDHHVVILEASREEPALYYSATLNYLLYKAVNLNLGALIRNQFTRPLRALIEAGLEWREEEWQYEVAKLSKVLTNISRSHVLRQLGLPGDLAIAELVDRGMDIKVKQVSERVESVLKTLFNFSEWRKIVKTFEENVDERRLVESLTRWVVERRQA